MTLKRPTADEAHRPAAGASLTDWSIWIRLIERKRRLAARLTPPGLASIRGGWRLTTSFLTRFTVSSFKLDGLEVTEAQATSAMAASSMQRPFRSRLSQRLRNHLAILWNIQRAVAANRPLKGETIVRWYTSVSCGLSNTGLDEATMDRLQAVAGRISSPRLRLQPAVQDVARVHARLIADPVVPSFNGILARLMLCYHLGRCGLPPVMFDPVADRPLLTQESALLPRLMDLIDASYSVLLA
jgi:hypothetical protein